MSLSGKLDRLAKHTINLPHYPLSPLNSRSYHRFRARTPAIIKQVLRTFQVPRHKDSGHDCQHALAAFVHAVTLAPFAFASPCELCYFWSQNWRLFPMTED